MTSSDSDVTLLLTSDGKEWGTYVSGKLGTVGDLRQGTLILDEQQYENPPELTLACRQSTVLLFLATPDLLNYLRDKAAWFSQTLLELPPGGALIVLLLVERGEVDDVTRDRYVTSGWRFLEVGETVEAVRGTIAQVLDELEKCQRARKEVAEEEEEEEVKDVEVVKEVKEVEVVKDMTKKKTKPKPHSRGSSVELFPAEVYQPGVRVAMVFKEEVKGEVTVKMEQADQQIAAHRVNSTVYTFTVPPVNPGRYKLLVYADNVRLQHCRPELSVRGPDLAFFTSPYYLQQALGLKDLQELDLKLVENFNNSLPDPASRDLVFKGLKSSDGQEQQKNSDTKYPTLLHWAAGQGLCDLSAALVECAGSQAALSIRNCDGRDPAQLAEHAGFDELAEFLVDFMELLAAKDICDDYIDMCQQSEGVYEDGYVCMPFTPPREDTRGPEVEDVVKELPSPADDRPPVPPPRLARGKAAAPQRSASERQFSPCP